MLSQIYLSYGQKKNLLDYRRKNPGLNRAKLATWAAHEFKLPHPPYETTIGHIINNALKFDTLQPQDLKIKRTRTVSFQQLEETLKNWVLQQQHQKICLSGDIIKEKGRDFAKRLGMLETDLLFRMDG
jgi:Tc5 transposase DNA-binding domain